MAKDSSFDVVSVVDMQEVDNACQQATREISQRYDLKGTGASLAFAKGDGVFTIEAPSDVVAGQVRDILGSKLVKRPSKDALQQGIALLRGNDYGQPLQYVNYR